jgi:hypothetical protein
MSYKKSEIIVENVTERFMKGPVLSQSPEMIFISIKANTEPVPKMQATASFSKSVPDCNCKST